MGMSRHRMIGVGFILASNAWGCGLAFEDLELPHYTWDQDNGLCGITRVIDRHRSVWESRGCEEPGPARYFEEGAVTGPEYERLQTLYSTFPDQAPRPKECHVLHRFVHETADGANGHHRTTCGSGNIGDLSDLKEPYLSVARLFLEADQAAAGMNLRRLTQTQIASNVGTP